MKKILLLASVVACFATQGNPVNSMLAANETEMIEGDGLYPIPDGAVRVEYLESTGTQMINTKVFIETNDTFCITQEVCFSPDHIGVRQLQGYCTSRRGYWGVSTSGNYEMGGFTTSTAARNWDIITFIRDSKSTFRLCINGINVRSVIDTWFMDRGTFTLFFLSGTWTPCYMKQGEVSIILNDELVRLFVPIRVFDGEEWNGCMFDRVSGELFFNSGTGEFIIGPDLEED